MVENNNTSIETLEVCTTGTTTVGTITDITSETDTAETETIYTDVFGTALRPGTLVVGVHYNGANRRGYYTIREDYEPLPVDVINGAYIEYQRLLDLIDTNKVSTGRKHGYLHVMA